MPNPFVEDFPGRCISCGFLGQYNSAVGSELYEVYEVQRAEGQVPGRGVVWCLKRAADLHKDWGEAVMEVVQSGEIQYGQDSQSKAAWRKVFRRERGAEGCPDWYEWVQSFDPKWHYEDWRMTKLEEMRLAQANYLSDMQTKMREEDRLIAAEHAKTTQALLDLQRNNEADSKRINAEAGRLSRFNLVIAAAALVLAISAFFYPNGVEWLNNHLPQQPHEVSPPVFQAPPVLTPVGPS